MLSGVNKRDAYSRAMAFTAEHGFTVLKSDKDAGVISAAQSSSYGSGKIVPLNIILAEAGADTRINLNYTTAAGVFSPEEAIKKHFCLTIAAAGSGVGGSSAAQVPVSQDRPSPAAQPPARRSTPKGFAVATSDQQQVILTEIPKVIPNENMRQMVISASTTIATFIERVACVMDHPAARALNEFAAPGANLGNWFIFGPRGKTNYHNHAACMTVTRVQGWSAPANNALQFEVIYKAEDSGEIGKSAHEIVRQPDGVWLFTR